MLFSPSTVFCKTGRTLLAALPGLMVVVLRGEVMWVTWFFTEVRVCRTIKAESKLEICEPISNVEIKGGEASTSGPHLGDFLQAAEDKSLL